MECESINYSTNVKKICAIFMRNYDGLQMLYNLYIILMLIHFLNNMKASTTMSTCFFHGLCTYILK
jgi:hypothetical protein